MVYTKLYAKADSQSFAVATVLEGDSVCDPTHTPLPLYVGPGNQLYVLLSQLTDYLRFCCGSF